MKKSIHTAAYTLVEILITMGVSALLVTGVLTFFIQNLDTQGMTTGKLLINNDIRTLTTEMSEEARDAAFFRIYPSFTVRFDDTNGNGVQEASEFDLPDGLTTGRSGDFLVLYFYDPSGALNADGSRRIVRAVGYFRDSPNPSDPSVAGPVRKYQNTASPMTLPSTSLASTFPEVVELSRGLSSGRLFFNFGGSIIIRGELEHPGSRVRRATNTYNFTIGPRG